VCGIHYSENIFQERNYLHYEDASNYDQIENIYADATYMYMSMTSSYVSEGKGLYVHTQRKKIIYRN